MGTHRHWLFVASLILGCAQAAWGQDAAKPASAAAVGQQAGKPGADDADKAENDTVHVLAKSLLQSAMEMHPIAIRTAIEAVHASLDEKYKDDPKGKVSARIELCGLLAGTAPKYALEEYESLLAHPSALEDKQVLWLRYSAGMVCMSLGRREDMVKQFDKVAKNPTAEPSMLAIMWFFRALSAADREEGMAAASKVMEYAERSDCELPVLAADFCRIQWCDDVEMSEKLGKAFQEQAERFKDARVSALTLIVAAETMSKSTSEKERATLFETALARLQTVPITDPKERVGDLMFMASAARHVNGELFERIARDAESLARERLPNKSADFRTARLVHAKALRHNGAQDLAAYADLDTDEELEADFKVSWSCSNGQPVLKVHTGVKKTGGKNKK